jgi:Glycosyltransferase family 87
MWRRVRENVLCAFMAGVGCATMAWLGLYGFGWNDYEMEAQPSFEALAHGHILSFLRLAPAYSGSLIERAPFALAPGLWGGGQLAVYRMVALPCLLAAAVLGVWLVAQMRSQGHAKLSRAVALGVCVANPLTLSALEVGHPEELLGACLCVAAVLLAGRGRTLWAGLVLGLAIANKDWALLAVGPVLLALPRERVRTLAIAGALAAALMLPFAIAAHTGSGATQSIGGGQQTGAIFQPWQVWWFLGTPNHIALPKSKPQAVKLNAPLSTRPGFRTPPPWLTGLAHPLIVLIALPLTLLALRRRRTAGAPLLLLAFLLLLRCALDPWDFSYYLIPFSLALLAWETQTPGRRPPVLALSSVVLAWISFQWLPTHSYSPDLQSVFFLAWTLPLTVLLGLRLYAPQGIRSGRRHGPQEMTVSSLGRRVSTS